LTEGAAEEVVSGKEEKFVGGVGGSGEFDPGEGVGDMRKFTGFMGDHDECGAGLGELAEDFKEGIGGAGVEAIGRLVEKEDAWTAGKGSSEEDALLLAAGEIAEGTVSEVCNADLIEGLVDKARLGTEPAQGGLCGEGEGGGVKGGHGPEGVEALALRDEGDGKVGVAGEGASEGREDAGDSTEEGGFAGAIRAVDSEAGI